MNSNTVYLLSGLATIEVYTPSVLLKAIQTHTDYCTACGQIDHVTAECPMLGELTKIDINRLKLSNPNLNDAQIKNLLWNDKTLLCTKDRNTYNRKEKHVNCGFKYAVRHKLDGSKLANDDDRRPGVQSEFMKTQNMIKMIGLNLDPRNANKKELMLFHRSDRHKKVLFDMDIDTIAKIQAINWTDKSKSNFNFNLNTIKTYYQSKTLQIKTRAEDTELVIEFENTDNKQRKTTTIAMINDKSQHI
eukprot:549948_1